MSKMADQYTKYNTYLSLLRTLKFEEDEIFDMTWSPDGQFLAAIGYGEVAYFVPTDGSTLAYAAPRTAGILSSIAWSPDGRLLAMRTTGGLYVCDPTEPTNLLIIFEAALDAEGPVAWSPDSKIIAVARPNGKLALWMRNRNAAPRLFDLVDEPIYLLAWHPTNNVLAMNVAGGLQLLNTNTGKIEAKVRGDFSHIAWSPDGQSLLAGGEGVISIFDHTLRLRKRIEGHPGLIERVAISGDGRMLASASIRQLRIYRADTDEPVFVHRKSGGRSKLPFFAFDPTGPRVAIHSDKGIDVVQYNPYSLATTDPSVPSIHYRNAKIVLVGDSGVGKSGLGLVLSGQKFHATDSTHGRQIYLLDKMEVPQQDGWIELREIYLWDLAGQPGYRLIHQMHLDEIATALVLFDASNTLNPFAGVSYWARAIKQAIKRRSGSNYRTKMILVAARVDRGTIRAHRNRIEEFVERNGFTEYVETSAKDGRNIAHILSSIKCEVDWEELPQVSSTKLFHDIREFLLEQQGTGRVLSTVTDLMRDFFSQFGGELEYEELQHQFETSLRLAHSRGIINRFSFGNLVLLRPELVDSYASALIDAALREPDGLGCIAEDDAKAGHFDVPADDRLVKRDIEQFLCTAMVEELIRNEIALIEFTEKGQQLVFPSQATREHPELPDPPGKSVIIDFAGPVENVYTTLIVRLTHSGQYSSKETWRNATTFIANTGGECGIYLNQRQEDRAELVLFFDEAVSSETQFQFEEYVLNHLRRRAAADTIRRRRIYTCLSCNIRISDEQAQRRIQLGYSAIRCNVCDASISLLDKQGRISHLADVTISEMNALADQQREFEAGLVSASGEMRSTDFLDWAGSERPTLAIVFTDVKGSTAKQIDLGNQRWRGIIKEHFERGKRLIERHDGYCLKPIGDSLMVAFHNAIDGLNFALDFSADPGERTIMIRAAMHIGIVGVQDNDAYGNMVNYTARIQNVISNAEIWVSREAKHQIDEEKAENHRALRWHEERNIVLKDYGPQTLWSTRKPPRKQTTHYH